MKQIIVIDDFYESPYAVRQLALNKAEYLEPSALPENFPGTESKKSYYSASLVHRIERAIGEKVVVDPTRFSFGAFAKTYACDERKKVVHVDTSDWTGLIYLSLPRDCKGGTLFYEERETGIDSVPDASRVIEMGFADVEDFKMNYLAPRSREASCWKVSAQVGMKFNRMLLFRAGSLFHSAEDYFGTNDEDCRLIQLFFFQTEKV